MPWLAMASMTLRRWRKLISESGSDLAIRTAAVALMKSSLDKIPEVLALAVRAIRVVRRNLFWAFF